MDIYSKIQAVFVRFLRGAVAGATATMILVQFNGGNSFADLTHFLSSLAIAGVTGAVTGGLLALDKYFRA